MIQTSQDLILEGDHDFSVLVENVTPNGALTHSDIFTVTITDAADGGYFYLQVS